MRDSVTARGELGALAAAVALAGVVFAVQEASNSPSTVRGLTASQRSALTVAAASASESTPVRRAAPASTRRRARRATVAKPRAHARARAHVKQKRAAPKRATPVLRPVTPRVNTAPRVVAPAAPRRPRVTPVVVRPQRPIVRAAPKPAPKPAPRPQPKPKPSGEPFVSSG